MLTHRILSCAATLLISAATFAQTEPSSQPASQPTTQASILPAVQSILDQVAGAYTDAKTLSFTGKISLDFDAGGEQKHESTDFTASFVGHNQFRHEVKDDVLIVSTGHTVYAYLPATNEYVGVDA